MNTGPRNAYQENSWIITNKALAEGVGDYSKVVLKINQMKEILLKKEQ